MGIDVNAIFLIDLLTATWLGFLGACIGSFLNVVAYRMPLGMSIVWKPSHCPKCSHPIRPYDNVPVLGWLWLRGRCRDCREPISPRYAIVEFVMGATFFVLAYVELFSGGANLPGGPLTEFTGAIDVVWNPQWQVCGVYAYHGALLSLLMSLLLIDRDRQVAPTKLIGIGVAAGLLPAIIYPHLHSSVPSFFFTAWPQIDGVVGATLGFLLGSAITKLVDRGEKNLTVSLMFLGAFLGWQGLAAVVAVLFVTALKWMSRSTFERCRVGDAIFVYALIHLMFWQKLIEMLSLN